MPGAFLVPQLVSSSRVTPPPPPPLELLAVYIGIGSSGRWSVLCRQSNVLATVSYCRVTNDPALQWLHTAVLFALASAGQEFGPGWAVLLYVCSAGLSGLDSAGGEARVSLLGVPPCDPSDPCGLGL